MDRIVESHQFGPHRVDVMECVDDDGTLYRVLADDVMVTAEPLESRPRFEEVVRIYARWQSRTGPG